MGCFDCRVSNIVGGSLYLVGGTNTKANTAMAVRPVSFDQYGVADIFYTVSLGVIAEAVGCVIDYRSDNPFALHNIEVILIVGFSYLGATLAAQILLQRYFALK
jgi:hypothetical protein